MPSKRPENTAFKQQRLKSWQPLLTPKSVIPLFFVIGIIFVPIGIVLQMASNNVTEVRFEYTGCNELTSSTLVAPNPPVSGINRWSYDNNTKTCQIEFKVPSSISGPVYIYYRLTSFYQNNRMYVKSFDLHQLGGSAVTDKATLDSSCSPLSSYPSLGDTKPLLLGNGTEVKASPSAIYYPCGLIANSLFSDVFSDLSQISNGVLGNYRFDSSQIAWPSDASRFVNSSYPTTFKTDESLMANVIPPPFWRDAFPQWANGYNLSNFPQINTMTHLQVWMRTAGLPTFRKLYGSNSGSDLAAGNWNISITYRFDTGKFGGTKSIVISNSSLLGGKNAFLGGSYILTGLLCVCLGVAFLIRNMVSPRKLGDHKLLSWNNEPPKKDDQNALLSQSQ